jgi:DNA-binding beta-propeller fold protein YncE
MTPRIPFFAFFTLVATACSTPSPQREAAIAAQDPSGDRRLPTGARLDPAGVSRDLGPLPLAMMLSPDKRRVVVLLNGWREQGIQVLDRASGQLLQTIPLPAVFLGMAFSPDAKSLYVSGGNQDVIYRFDWRDGRATLADSIALAVKEKGKSGTRYPAGLAISRDGRTLYVAENLGDSLAVVDLTSRRVVQRLATEKYPYGVVVGLDGKVYASAWGGWTVSAFPARADGTLGEGTRIRVARHPSAMALSPDGFRLYVASGSTDKISVIATRSLTVVGTLDDAAPAIGEGSTPNALALSPDGRRLFVAEADNNAVGVFDLSATTSGISGATGNDKLAGRIPVGWYPSAVVADGTDLLVANAKGRGTAPNPGHWQPGQRMPPHTPDYTLGQINGTLTTVTAETTPADLAALSTRVATANGWNSPQPAKKYPPFRHVIYIVKENRTYDQVFGDLPQADGDTSLLFFPRSVSPNHHALAERFGIFDRFFVNAEVSPDGHNWSMAAYVTDYAEKTISSNYSGRGRTYDYQGTNRGVVPDEDVNEPSSGYLWNLAERAGITYRNYGEFVSESDDAPGPGGAVSVVATKRALMAHTNTAYSGWNLDIPDQARVDVWLREFQEFVRGGNLPALEIMLLPNDHTSGASAGRPTPRAYMADNDLALGRIIEALSKSPYWKNTVVFVLEDDAQDGPDHVDSHRSPLLVISAYNRGKVFHRFANTTDVVATIEDILGLGRMSQFDHYGRPLREIWETTPDLTPYVALRPSVPLDEKNPPRTALAEASKKLALEKVDQADEELFNRILWSAIKGDRPFPGTTRMSALEAKVSR